MPIDVYWDNPEKSVLHWDLKPGWTWFDYDNAIERSNAMADEVGRDQKIVMITDHHASRYPPGRFILRVVTRIIVDYPNVLMQVDRWIIVNPTLAGRALVPTLQVILRGRIRVCDTLQDAYALLKDEPIGDVRAEDRGIDTLV
jgi:hypothetical protein